MASGMRQLAGTLQFLNSPVIWLNLNRTGVLKSCRCIAAPLPFFRWLTHCSAGSRIFFAIQYRSIQNHELTVKQADYGNRNI